MRNTPVEERLAMVKADTPDLDKLLAVYPKEDVERLIKNKDKLSGIIKAFDRVGPIVSTNAIVMTCTNSCPFMNVCILSK